MNPDSATKAYRLPNAEFVRDNEPFIAINATVNGSVFFIFACVPIFALLTGDHLTLTKRYAFLIFIMLN